MELRPYQTECVQSTLKGFAQFNRQLVVVPTGGGKTVIFAHLAKKVSPLKTLILAHREELINQACDKIRRSVDICADIEKAEQCASLQAPVVVASVQTMARRLDKWPQDHFGLIVADEAHHSISTSWQTVLNHFDGWTLGVTATPDRGDKKNLGSYFENIAFEIGLFDLVKQGFLSPIVVKSMPLQIDLTGVRTVAGDYSEADLGDALAPYLAQIAAMLKAHAAGRKTLVFVPLIATSKTLVDICKAQGIKAAHVDGTSPDRAAILARFARGEIELLSNAMLLTEGYDEPSVDCVVILRPTKSRPLFSQMVGRGTRVSPGKADLLLLDFLWLHERHNLIRPAHLIAGSNDMADAITRQLDKAAAGNPQGEFDLEEMLGLATAERENSLREALKAQAKKQARTVNAMDYCLSVHNLDAADYAPTMPWHGLAITPKQSEQLLRAGIDADSVGGRGHASALLDTIWKRQKQGLATPKQVNWLRRLGHHAPETASFEDASAYLDQRWAKN